MKKFILFLLIGVFIMPLTCYGEWTSHQYTDKMDGTVTKYIECQSKNTLQGWLQKTKILLVLYDSGAMGIMANKGSFAIDDTRWEREDFISYQYIRVKFDNNKLFTFQAERTDDGGFLIILEDCQIPVSTGQSYHVSKSYIIKNMIKHSTMYLELGLFNKIGQQIAEFDLTGFTEAYNKIHN